MTESETLYAKLLGETARITWKELEPFFARGSVLIVGEASDLVAVALALAENRTDEVGAWLADGSVRRADDTVARAYAGASEPLWAVVVAPWVLVQSRVAGEGDRSPRH